MARTSSENLTPGFCNDFSIIPSHHARKVCAYYFGIKLASAIWRSEENPENLSSGGTSSSTQLQNRSFQIVYWTRTAVKCTKLKKSACKAYKTAVFKPFIVQICNVLCAVASSSSLSSRTLQEVKISIRGLCATPGLSIFKCQRLSNLY